MGAAGRILPWMTGEHERYEQLAVGHVLGGLRVGDAADFRTHLLGCRHCRSRVAELRGIASDLEAAERDERTRGPVRTETEVTRRTETPEGDTARAPRVTIRHVTIATVVVVVFALAMAFWNLHLRTTSATYLSVAESRGDTLGLLASGEPVAVDLADGVAGLVVLHEDRIAITLTGVRPLEAGERLVAWFLDPPRDATRLTLARFGQIPDDGSLSTILPAHDADELVITRERGEPGLEPRGDEVLRAPRGATEPSG